MHTIAQNVIEKFGSHQAIADILGIKVSWVYRFTYPKKRGGTDGLIPYKHHAKLLQAAADKGINLQPNDFYNPPSVHNDEVKDGNHNGSFHG